MLIGGTYTAMHMEVDVPDPNAPNVVIMTKQMVVAAEGGTAGHFSRRNGCKCATVLHASTNGFQVW